MKKALLIALGLILTISGPAYAFYSIDGDVSDWGINLNEASYAGYLNTNTPSGVNVDYATDDHWGGYSNVFDVEAIYFDNDADYAYMAIITGLPQNYGIKPGDVFFEVGANSNPFGSGYDPTDKSFAVNVFSENLHSVNTWDETAYSTYADPYRMDRDIYGDVTPDNTFRLALGDDFIYTSSPINSHYVMEGKIPLDTLGLSYDGSGDSDVWIHWSMACGNDYLNMKGDVNPYVVPEPASMILFGSGLLGLAGLRRKKIRG